MNKRYQVFVSSTYEDLKDERQEITKTLMSIDCIPAGMESFGAIDQEQFEFIKTVIDDCDYYLLIIGARYGSIGDQGISYTEMEYDYAVSKGIKVIALLHENIENLPASKHDLSEAAQVSLDKFKVKVKTGRHIDYWNNSTELPGKVAISLMRVQKMFPAIGWIRADQGSSLETLEQINNLRNENDLLKLKLSEPSIVTNNKKLAQGNEEITIHGISRCNDFVHGIDEETTWSYRICWDAIIKLIGPYLQTATTAYNLKVVLAKESKEEYADVITDKSWHQIQIQLQALKIIDLDDELLALTPHGIQLLIEISSIKSIKPDL